MDSNYALQYQRLERDHWWWIVRRDFVFSALRRQLPPCQEGKSLALLEVGCGAGTNLHRAHADFDCQGVEPDPHLREVAIQEAGCPVVKGSLPGPLPFDDHSFDVCLLLDVLEHVEDDLAAMLEIRRVVRPGGLIVINVPAMPSLWSIHDEVNQHFRRYTAGQISDVLHNARLTTLSTRYWGTALVPLVWFERKILHGSVGRDEYDVQVPSALVQSLLGGLTRLDYALNPLCRVAGTSLFTICSA